MYAGYTYSHTWPAVSVALSDVRGPPGAAPNFSLRPSQSISSTNLGKKKSPFTAPVEERAESHVLLAR